jgi:hypothetical protein
MIRPPGTSLPHSMRDKLGTGLGENPAYDPGQAKDRQRAESDENIMQEMEEITTPPIGGSPSKERWSKPLSPRGGTAPGRTDRGNDIKAGRAKGIIANILTKRFLLGQRVLWGDEGLGSTVFAKDHPLLSKQ